MVAKQVIIMENTKTDKRFKVVSDYESTTDNDPIYLEKGDEVVIKERSEDVSQWENWVCCISRKTGKEGWIPIQILRINGNVGISIKNYSANELTVRIDEIVKGYEELNGWIWSIKLNSQEYGWVPLENVVEIQSESI